jgi:hypothetical protein
LTTQADAPAEQAEEAPRSGMLSRVDGHTRAIYAVAAIQALWLGALMSRGWFYQADFSNLAAPTGRPLSWSYLTQPQGGHLDIIGRVVFFVLNRIDPLNHPLTIALRLIAQACTTVLLGRLLVLLVGRRPGVIMVLAMYAASPLLVQSELWFTASVNLLLSQIFVLWAIRFHVRYSLTRDLRFAAYTGLTMFAATLVAEQAAVTALVLPLLSFGFLHAGDARERLAETVRSWPAWVLVAAPIGAFVLFFLGSDKYHGRLHTGFSAFVHSIWDEWTYSIIPGMVGGPWSWTAPPNAYFSLANPSGVVRVLTAAVVLGVIAYTVLHNRTRAIIGWSMPFLVSGVGIAVVAVGRYTGLGLIISKQFEHAAYAAVPLAIGAVLAFWPTTPDAIRGRLDGAPDPHPDGQPALGADADDAGSPRATRASRRKPRRLAPAVTAVVVVIAASAASAITYTNRWAQSPARKFVKTLRSSVQAAGPKVSVFDTYLPNTIQPGINDYRKAADLIRLFKLDGVTFNTGQSPRIVDRNGRLVPAKFYVAARVEITGTNAFCNDPIGGTAERVQNLVPQRPAKNEWYVMMKYFEQFPSTVYVQAVEGGRRIDPVGGSRVLLQNVLGRIYLQLPSSRPERLIIRGATPTTKVCVTELDLGYPFPDESGS